MSSPVERAQDVFSPHDLNRAGEQGQEAGLSPTFGEALGASARLENEVVSLVVSEATNLPSAEFNRVDPEFDITPDMLDGFEDEQDRLLDTFNADAFDAVKADIERERGDRDIQNASGWTGTALGFGASMASPTSLIPGGAMVRSGRLGFSALRSAGSVSGAAAVGTGLQEGVLQMTQQTRTGAESAVAIGSSVILGTLLGGAGAGLLSRAEFNKFSKALESDLSGEVANPSDVAQGVLQRLRSGGAAATGDLEKIDWEKELGIGGGRVAEAVAKATAAVKLNPGLELLTSPSMVTRKTFLRLTENHVATEGEIQGRSLGPAAETAMKRYDGGLAVFLETRRQSYRDARKAGFKGKMKDFDLAVARAGRRGDIDRDGNAFVTKAAGAWRELADLLKNEGVDVGLLDEGVKVKTAPSYLHRLYDQARIVASEAAGWKGPRFRSILQRYIKEQVQAAVARQEEIDLAKKISRSDDVNEQFGKAMDRVNSIQGRLTGRAEARDRKLSAIRKNEAERFDLLRGRAPREVIDAAKASKDDDYMVRAVREVSKPAKNGETYPVLQLLKQLGGVRKHSRLDQELRALGVTPQTVRGLITDRGRLKEADNLVAREHDLLANMRTDQNGYADPAEILEAVQGELAGAPVLTEDQLAEEAARDVLEANVGQWLRDIGLPENATVRDVRRHLGQALKNEDRLSHLDQSINRMNGELEEFDRLTDEISRQRAIAKAEADNFLDELNKLEADINEVRELANASPRVALVVDYADARKGLAKARYEQTNATRKIEAIERLDGTADFTPEMADQLRALRSDKNAIDERVIKAKAKVEKLKPMQPKDRGDDLDIADDMDLEAYAETITEDVFNRVTGKSVSDVPEWAVPVTQGPLKGRTLNIPDELIEGFLVNDMEMIARRYVRKMGPEIELTRNFGRADMKDALEDIRKDYRALRAKAKGQKEIDKLEVRERRDIKQVEAFRDILRGTYRTAEERSNWSALTRLALSWNFIRLLGGMTISSIPDLANVMTRQGMQSFVREGLPALLSNSKALRIAKRDGREWGTIKETVLQTRLAEMAELNDPYASGTPADRLMSNVVSLFSRMTFMGVWNDTLKTVVTVQAGSRIARLTSSSLKDLGQGRGKVADYGKLSSWDRAYLGKLGIDEGMASRVADQVQKFGVRENGVWGLDLRSWTDKEARRVVGAALAKEADGGVVTPGVSDRPLWSRSNPGKLVMQFKSFGLAAHQRIMLSRLQGRQKHLAEFLLFGTLMGMMVSYLKYIERGDFDRANALLENPGLWIADGFDRTGIAPVLMDISNTAEKLGMPFGVKSAAQALAGDTDKGADVSRYASRNTLGALGGPTVGTIQDIVSIVRESLSGEVTRSGARAAVRQVPFASLPGARTVMETQVKPALLDAVN